MAFRSFHHPDLSLPIVRRRIAEELLDLLFGVGEIVATRGRALTWSRSFPSRDSYNSAMYRLRQADDHRRTNCPLLPDMQNDADI